VAKQNRIKNKTEQTLIFLITVFNKEYSKSKTPFDLQVPKLQLSNSSNNMVNKSFNRLLGVLFFKIFNNEQFN
jgi:hypothetical protein